MRIAYSELYFSIKTPKLFARFRLPFFTSTGTPDFDNASPQTKTSQLELHI